MPTFLFSDIMNRDRKPSYAPGDVIGKRQETSQYAVMMIVLRRNPCTEHRIGKRCVAGFIRFGRPWPSVRSMKQAFAGSVANV
jgi:hypothetical protein